MMWYSKIPKETGRNFAGMCAEIYLRNGERHIRSAGAYRKKIETVKVQSKH